jgi:hypothetical protein
MIFTLPSRNSRFLPWFFVAGAMLLYIAIGINSGADVGWDLRNYHLYGGYRLLHGGFERDFFAAQFQSWLNPTLDAGFVFLTEHLPPLGVGISIILFQSLNIPLLYLLLRRCLPTPLHGSSAFILTFSILIIGLTGAMTLSEIGTTYGDLTVTVFIMASLVCLSQIFDQPKSIYVWILAAGIFTGIAVGLKLTNLAFIPGFFAIFFALKTRFKTLLLYCFVFGIGLTLGWLITGGYWAWKMWAITSNPLFPVFNGLFRSPLIDPVSAPVDDRFRAKSVLQVLQFPFLTAIGDHPGAETRFSDPRLAIAFLLSPLLFIKRPRGLHTAILLFFVISYFFWVIIFGVQRYTIALEFISGIVYFVLISLNKERIPYPVILLILMVLIVTFTNYPDWKNRISWDTVSEQGNWFHASVPPELIHPNTMFILFGDEPTSYVIPSLPVNDRFIRVAGNFEPAAHTQLYRLRSEAIAEHDGQAYSLGLHELSESELAWLKPLGWNAATMSCSQITTAVDTLFACPLRHK